MHRRSFLVGLLGTAVAAPYLPDELVPVVFDTAKQGAMFEILEEAKSNMYEVIGIADILSIRCREEYASLPLSIRDNAEEFHVISRPQISMHPHS